MPELELLSLRQRLERDKVPYCLATVVAVRGSASAKPGSKMLISAEGKNAWGWAGGSCAESFVLENAREAMREACPRLITADLTDEVFGLGLPCGGQMDIFLEPRLPPEELLLPCGQEPLLEELASHIGFSPQFQASSKSTLTPAECLLFLANAVAEKRGLEKKRYSFERNTFSPPSEFLLLGPSRITEELARLGLLLGWRTRVYGFNAQPENFPDQVVTEKAQAEYAGVNVQPKSFVVVASQHKGDPHYLGLALRGSVAYIGLVASRSRTKLVFERLQESGFSPEQLAQIHAPAGVDLQCRNPAEIALSIIVEILTGPEPRHDLLLKS